MVIAEIHLQLHHFGYRFDGAVLSFVNTNQYCVYIRGRKFKTNLDATNSTKMEGKAQDILKDYQTILSRDTNDHNERSFKGIRINIRTKMTQHTLMCICKDTSQPLK